MWLISYFVDKVTIKESNEDIDNIKDSLLDQSNFLEAYLFGNNQSYHLTNKDSKFVSLVDEDKDNNKEYIDEYMLVSSKFLDKNNIKNNSKYYLQVRNYYDFNDDNIIYISKSRIVDMEER